RSRSVMRLKFMVFTFSKQNPRPTGRKARDGGGGFNQVVNRQGVATAYLAMTRTISSTLQE
ncbi:MAG TPA: hypothetical protein P5329_14405, partial [Candidatus Competibacteraceae bacterium]|nr:hypothetical protein [Candidatus Competibacteraceae bacterium]